jgi:predicted transposase YbfD/YdcC
VLGTRTRSAAPQAIKSAAGSEIGPIEGDLANAREHVTTEKGYGREEMRAYLQLPAPKSLPGFTLSEGLKTIGVVTSRCLRDGKETIEARYYISSLPMGVKQFARVVRGPWGIENTCTIVQAS